MSTRIRATWLTPTSIEPRLFANRDEDRRRIEDTLEDLFVSHTRRYRMVVFGDRGRQIDPHQRRIEELRR